MNSKQTKKLWLRIRPTVLIPQHSRGQDREERQVEWLGSLGSQPRLLFLSNILLQYFKEQPLTPPDHVSLAWIRDDIRIKKINLNATSCSCQIDIKNPNSPHRLDFGKFSLSAQIWNWSSEGENASFRCHSKFVIGSGSWNPYLLRTSP